MSDVALVEKLVVKHQDLKKEIAKVIIIYNIRIININGSGLAFFGAIIKCNVI